jgi:GntR family transcriptional regulator
MARKKGYADVAEEYRQKIRDGALAPGDRLPPVKDLMEIHGVARATVARALTLLKSEGLIVTRAGAGTVVRDRRRVRVPLSRYETLLTNGRSDRGPWQTATAEQGYEGYMLMLSPAAVEVPAPADVAERLDVEPGAPVIVRRRRALIGDDTVQLQEAWYPLDVAQAARLDRPEKVEGGTLRVLMASGVLLPGVVPHTVERVTADTPTQQQISSLSVGERSAVLRVDRVHFNEEGRPVELIRIIGAADRLELVYDLPPVQVQPRQDRADRP